MTLLEIFAGYTSFTLQNALDARRAHELAKKDDLTGLYNDRWFNVRMTETLALARESGTEAALIFMDLANFKVVNDCHGHLLCEVLNPDGSVHWSNTRAHLREVAEKYKADEPWFGIEQEYTLFDGNKPLGWPDKGFPAPQGGYYCGVGNDEVFGREVVEAHASAVCAPDCTSSVPTPR